MAARLALVAALSLLVLAVALLALTGSALAATPAPDTTITASFPSGEPSPPTITATAAILIDADTGAILFSKNANTRLPMASTTKIMTAIVVLETLDPEQKVTVSANAVSVDGSKASLVKGEVLTVDQLLHGLLIISGNDAAIALAEAAGGSVKGFVGMMNAKAKEMGLKNTHFVNPHGVQPKGADSGNHYSSAKDLALMAQYARKYPLFREIVDSESITLPAAPGQTEAPLLGPQRQRTPHGRGLGHRHQDRVDALREVLPGGLGHAGRHLDDLGGARRRHQRPALAGVAEAPGVWVLAPSEERAGEQG